MIRVLPPEVVNQIAAGEVVERPASVVKELLENSLDAGAQRIRVEIQGGGAERIAVLDDGGGFAPEDLRLAFASHATSKLAALADLDHIASLGFRGEALASIGAIARCRIVSRRAGDTAGAEIRCDGGQLGELRPAAAAPGTLIEVRDLFFNTPARRRFLRTPQAERARIHELMQKLALVRLDVDFTLVADGQPLLRLPAGTAFEQRVVTAFGRELAGRLWSVERSSGPYTVRGLLADPELARRDSTRELLWINGRLARERAATAAIRQAMRESLMGGRFPVYFLQLGAPPELVDVNVHPAKAEVRFVESRRVAGLLHDAVRAAAQQRGAVAAVGASDPGSAIAERPVARSGFPDLPHDLFARDRPPPVFPFPRSSPTDAPAEAPRPNPFASLPERFLQVHDLWLVFAGTDGIVVVDQHALHERVLYEQLCARDEGRPARIQRLLVPEVVELAPRDKAWLLEAAEALAESGFLVADFGGLAVAVHGIPALLARSSPRALLDTLLADPDDEEARPRARAAIQERFHSMACRAAVRSGDRLQPAEITALVEQARTLRHPHNCPHGRPTTLNWSQAELERWFRRRT